MSKSAENELSRINLTDPPEVIANKVRTKECVNIDFFVLNIHLFSVCKLFMHGHAHAFILIQAILRINLSQPEQLVNRSLEHKH